MIAPLLTETLEVIRNGLPDLPEHPVRKRWVPVALHRRDPWAAVWFVMRREKAIFESWAFASFIGPDGSWGTPQGGGGGGGAPPFVDQHTRGWTRPRLRVGPYGGYLQLCGMTAVGMDPRGVSSPARVWTLCAVESVSSVRVERDGSAAYEMPVTSPIGALIIVTDGLHPSTTLVPLDGDEKEFRPAGRPWAVRV